MRRFGAVGCGLLAIPMVLSLAGCGDDQVPDAAPATGVTQAAPHPKVPIQSFAPETTAGDDHADAGSSTGGSSAPQVTAQLTNDPSAPIDTPVCGAALREAASAGEAVYGDGIASGSTCPRNACFEPLTGTFIAATGARSVCR